MGYYDKQVILVCLDWYNNIPQTGQLISNRNLFIIVLRPETFKTKELGDSESGEGSFLIGSYILAVPSLHGGRDKAGL